MISDELQQKIAAWVKRNGYDHYELYADYHDEIDDKTIRKFLESEHPRMEFEDYMGNIDKYCDGGYYTVDAFIEAEFMIVEWCRKEFDINDEIEDDELRECLWDCNMCVCADEDHFLHQDVLVDVFLTNDEEANHEHTLNTVYPAEGVDENEKIQDINNSASLLWLAKQQGYNKRQFYNYMHERPNRIKSKFLASVRQELLNKFYSISKLVFLQRYTLGELLDIAEGKRLLTIPVGTMCGLFDDWNGSGSIFEIELEKPVTIPCGRFLLLPDESYKYNVGDVYGMCGSAWKYAA